MRREPAVRASLIPENSDQLAVLEAGDIFNVVQMITADDISGGQIFLQVEDDGVGGGWAFGKSAHLSYPLF